MDDIAIADSIKSATTIESAYAECKRTAQTLGFRYFLLGFRLPVPLTRPMQLVLSGYPSAWRARYDEQRFMLIDPVLKAVLTSPVPVEWDNIKRDSPAVAQLFEEAASFGLAHGLTIPMHGALGESSLLSLARAVPLPSDRAERAQLVRRAQWLATHLHECLRRIAQAPSDQLRGEPPRRLSERERQCLRFAAEGFNSGEIATMLNITERTVVFHFGRCQEKLQVGSRSQAVARAIALGEVSPEMYPDRLANSQRLFEDRVH
jgi:DNA-binding CsgD family transcriptional regulator